MPLQIKSVLIFVFVLYISFLSRAVSFPGPNDTRVDAGPLPEPVSATNRRVSMATVRDLLVVVDSSSGIHPGMFSIMKTQLSRLVKMLCLIPNPFDRYHRMALLQFSNTVRVVFDFNDKPSTDLVRQGIQSMSHMGGDRCIGNALEYARGMFTAAKGMRSDPNVIHEVLLLTSGPSNCGSSLYAATRRLYQMANVYVLGVGALRPSDVLQLNQIGNMPTNRHIFGIDGFNTLSGLVEELEAQSAAVPCVPFDI
ncbi:hypothetical protein DPMN_088588 [Dreissena polymorpha]|uniref:VWFA domain-containing protein n=1 Tax=Dreissena polymorpha TaxID=45954 RepID=A0A9D4KVB6_DREPO|nr:hypothetical protein DPMN_088588 [Dreissena polymorpha]